jgi:NAD(P)-dependent dehydrogenase (short-subunit alcohol dehydrogenase family)
MESKRTQNGPMAGKRAIVTGPTSGFGREIAVQLAAFGAEVVLACRDLERGERTAAEIAQRTGARNCAVMRFDAADQRSVREFARQFRDKFPRLDVLVNNAGINSPRRQVSADGIELTFATNVLGYYLLTRELLDLLRASAPARIVNVASTFAIAPDLADLQFARRRYDGRKAYAQSKACDRLLTWALARRLEGSGVTANAMAPGLVVKTGLHRDTSRAALLFVRMLGLFIGRTIAQGADTAIWLASSPEAAGVSGGFFELRKEKPCKFRNMEVEEKLWRICQGLTAATAKAAGDGA